MKKKLLRFKIITAAVLAVAAGIIFAVANSGGNEYVAPDIEPVTNSDDSIELGEPKITFTTELQAGETLEFSLNTATAYIDWGDGEPVKCDGGEIPSEYDYYDSSGNFYSGELKGNTIKIYSAEDITHFNCMHQKLSALDVSRNVVLGNLNCSHNELTELDVSQNIYLGELNCGYNKLKTLDISHNKILDVFYCNNNQFTTLDVSDTPINILNCSHNELTELDVSKNTDLKWIICSYNNLTSLDVSKNTELYLLDYRGNDNITPPDVSNNTELEYLNHDFYDEY